MMTLEPLLIKIHPSTHVLSGRTLSHAPEPHGRGRRGRPETQKVAWVAAQLPKGGLGQ